MAIHRTAACPNPLTLRSPIARFRADVLAGLNQSSKRLPSKYFYDELGSELFDRICELPEYYLTRAELAVMRRYSHEMSEALGPNCRIIEYGSGSSIKTPLLLEQMENSAGYLAVDISREHLLESTNALQRRFPELDIMSLWADFTLPIDLPAPHPWTGRHAVYFPGSTIGNFEPDDAIQLLKGMAELVGARGALLIGLDPRKPAAVVEPAYNDAAGVTAKFNLNLLARINRELGANFDLAGFEHRAFFNEIQSRVEMHLVSRRAQTIRIGQAVIPFAEDEHICTEYSYKHSAEAFGEMAAAAGFELEQTWTDDRGLFRVQYLTIAGAWAN